LPPYKIEYRVNSVAFNRLDGDATEVGVCPPCDLKIGFKTEDEEDLKEWLREFTLFTRTDYIVKVG